MAIIRYRDGLPGDVMSVFGVQYNLKSHCVLSFIPSDGHNGAEPDVPTDCRANTVNRTFIILISPV